MKIKAGIIGAAGYTGGELIRILIQHPVVEIVFCYSRSQAGKLINEIHDDLYFSDIKFTNEINNDVDVVFLCLPHGATKQFLEEHSFNNIKIIDLSNDFRLNANAQDFVYGLPELNKEKIKQGSHIANPGCFATAIQLAVLPLAKNQLLNNDIHISAITGSTGAGTTLSATSHFSWRNNNMSVYKAFTHQHLGEITESIQQLQSNFNQNINFIPYRGNFTRGIIATVYTKFDGSIEDAYALYENYYTDAPFVVLSNKNIHLKQVVNTNYALLYLEKHQNQLMIISCIDNLIKGASGQAVQNMNLQFGIAETTALQLKGIGF